MEDCNDGNGYVKVVVELKPAVYAGDSSAGFFDSQTIKADI